MSEVKLYRYYLPSIDGEGWAEIVLGSNGYFSAVSDYGNYAFAWYNHDYTDFRKFVIRISDDCGYVASKLSRPDCYQSDNTMRAVKNEILRLRRIQRISKDQARDAWDELGSEFGDLYSPHDFSKWHEDSDGANLIGDAFELATYDYPASARAFCQKTMLRLAEAIRVELAAEAAAMEAP